MSLTLTENAADYTPAPAGTFTARCTSLIDLGSQTSTYEGEAKTAKKVMLSFEITDGDTRRNDGTPFIVSKRFTASLHAKAGLRKFLESWRGRPFTPEELRGFDLKNVLALDCLIGVVHETKGDRTYANLSSVMRMPKGMAAGVGEIAPASFDLSAPDWAVYAGLSSRLQDQIAESPEYQSIPNKPQRVSVGSAPARPPAPATAMPEPPAYATEVVPFDADGQDIPF